MEFGESKPIRKIRENEVPQKFRTVQYNYICIYIYIYIYIVVVWLGIRSKGPTGQYFLLLPCLRLELTVNRAIT